MTQKSSDFFAGDLERLRVRLFRYLLEERDLRLRLFLRLWGERDLDLFLLEGVLERRRPLERERLLLLGERERDRDLLRERERDLRRER